MYESFREVNVSFPCPRFRKNPHHEPLSNKAFRALSLGAPVAEEMGFFCDSLTTGEELSVLEDYLQGFFEIEDSASLERTLYELLEHGHQGHYHWILEHDPQEDPAALAPEVEQSIKNYRANLAQGLSTLLAFEMITPETPLAELSIQALDLAHAVSIVRAGADLHLISTEKAWSILYEILALAQKTYSHWEGYALGYLVGRAMWRGSSSVYPDLVRLVMDCLEAEDSPWLQTQEKPEEAYFAKYATDPRSVFDI